MKDAHYFFNYILFPITDVPYLAQTVGLDNYLKLFYFSPFEQFCLSDYI